jgi:single-strand DNA-binding protein
MSLNKVILVGNVASDVENRATTSGTSVTNFAMATNDKWKDKEGKTVEKVEYHKIVVWGKTADLCAQYLKKGSKVYVEGKIETRSYEDKEERKRYTTEIKAESVQFLDKPSSMPAANPDVPKPQDDFGW